MNRPIAKPSRLATELVELADDMKCAGLIDAVAHGRIAQRHLADIAPMTQDEVKAMREHARMSQAVFARHLNVPVGHISQLERGEKRPADAVLALLDVIRRKGIEAIL